MPFAGLERLVTLADENGNELICNLWMRSALIQSRIHVTVVSCVFVPQLGAEFAVLKLSLSVECRLRCWVVEVDKICEHGS